MDNVSWVGEFAKYLVLTLLAIVIGAAMAVVACAQPAAPAKPTAVLVFSATWCPSCQALKPELAKITPEQGRNKFIVIDIDKFPATKERYRIEKIPTVIAVDGNTAREVKRAQAAGWTAQMLLDFADSEVTRELTGQGSGE